MQIIDLPLEGVDGRLLSDGPSTLDVFRSWWRPHIIGPQTRAIHFLGDIIPGSIMMTNWMACIHEPSHQYQIQDLS